MVFRLFWFAVGAGTATWWMKKHESYHHAYDWQQLQPAPSDANPTTHTNSPNGANQAQNSGCTRREKEWGWQYHRSWGNRTQAEWEEEKAKMEARVGALGRQATDTMTEASEAALDSLLSNVTALKAKLVEARERREREAQQQQNPNNQPAANSSQRWI